jgi:hypothetical protein
MSRTPPLAPAPRRDAALRRLRRAKQVMATGSVLLAGFVAAAAARTFPGHTTVTRTGSGAVRPTPAPRGTRSSTARPARAGDLHQTPAARPPSTSRRATRTRTATATTAPATTHTTRLTPPASAPTPAPVSSATVTSGGS